MQVDGSAPSLLLVGSSDPQRSLSPSLWRSAKEEKPAYELKFLLTLERAAELQSAAARRLSLDPFAAARTDGAYLTTTVYGDTPERDVWRRIGGLRRRKFRVRRYGVEPLVYLERKTKRGDRVRKRRCAVPNVDLSRLHDPAVPADWPGAWFRERIAAQRLEPVCCISYLRTAFIGFETDGPLRLTIDRELKAQPTAEWQPPAHGGGLALFAGQAVLEFKYQGVLPLLFKELMQTHRLIPERVSKYRSGVAAWSLCADGKEAG